MRKALRVSGAATALLVGLSTATLGAAIQPAQAAGGSVAINDPGTPAAGTVTLTGSTGVSSGEVTSVVYVLDATNSTALPTGSDCSGNGSVGGDDDLNGDGSVGDTLDCEIAGVVALDSSLAATSRLQVGLVGFANEAAAADLDPGAGTATFVPAGYTGGDPASRLDTVARSVVRDKIGLYNPRPLGGSGSGSAFNSAIKTALSALDSAPAGPKWIMFLSDGMAPVDDQVLAALGQSGVRLRTFGIGPNATCGEFNSLYKMATATGESCTQVAAPSRLAAGLTGSQPDRVNGVNVTIQGVSVAADVDAVGGWRAEFLLGAGTYTATVRAVMASGVTVTAQRRFTVRPAAAGTAAPGAGSVGVGLGAAKGTVAQVSRPRPSRAALPSRVTGRVGRPGSSLVVTPKLAGATVALQARPTAGAPWTTVDRSRVKADGEFGLSWAPRAGMRLLRVALRPYKSFGASAAAVPPAKISACSVAKSTGGWSLACKTTARDSSKVRLLKHGILTNSSRVHRGGFRIHGTGSVGAHSVDITVSKGHHIHLAL